MRIVLGAVGAIIVSGIFSAFGLGAAFSAVGAAVGLGCGWLLYGMIEDRQERARIASELEQDRKRYEQESQKRNG
jgi:hypothetical protein